MNRMQGLGLVLLVLGPGSNAEAKVSAKPIAELIRSADAIVLAKVVKIASGKVAVATVLERWKGELGDTVRFSLERGWPCDVSGAIVGERAVLVLDKTYKGRERITVTRDVHFLTFWGRGRMPIVDEGGKPFVRVQREVVLSPQDLEVRGSSDFPGDNLVELDELRTYVQKLLAPSAAQGQGIGARSLGSKL